MGVAYLEINKLPCLHEIDIPKCMNVYLIYRTKLGVIGFFVLSFLICFYTPIFKLGRIMVYQCPTVRPFHMSRSNLRTPWPIHFKFHLNRPPPFPPMKVKRANQLMSIIDEIWVIHLQKVDTLLT
jgi:hypothetical protein